MSNSAIDWVKQLVVGKASAKSVLREFADVVRDKPTASSITGKVWPPMHAYLSVAALEKATELDRKTVMSSIKYLKDRGFIKLAGKDGRTNQVQVFELLIDGAKISDENSTKNGIHNSTEIGIGTGTENGTVCNQETVPVFPRNSTGSPVEQYRFSEQTVPVSGHEPILNPIEPNKNPLGTGQQQSMLEDIEPKEKRAKLRRLRPENFEPNATCIALAKTHGLDLVNEFEKFKNHHDARGSRFSDWQAALRTWLGNAHEFSLNRGARTSSSRHTGFTQDKYEEAANAGIPA